MLGRKINIVHFVGEQNISCFLQWNAARESQFTRRTFRIIKLSAVRPFENNFVGIWPNDRPIEQDRQRNASPFGGSNPTEAPLHTFYFPLDTCPSFDRPLQC